MKKVKNLFSLACLVSLVLASSSCKKEQQVENGATGSLVAHIKFDQTEGTRAPSSAVPITSWANIKQIQIFLYDVNSGIIKFSDIIKPTITTGNLKQTWPMVPVGTYELVLVANAKNNVDSIQTSLLPNGPAMEWTGMNVRNVDVSNLEIYHMPRLNGFPRRIETMLGIGHTLKAYSPPSEIFMAYSTSSITIESGKVTDLSSTPFKLKREVALMRVRLQVNDKTQGFDN